MKSCDERPDLSHLDVTRVLNEAHAILEVMPPTLKRVDIRLLESDRDGYIRNNWAKLAGRDDPAARNLGEFRARMKPEIAAKYALGQRSAPSLIRRGLPSRT